MGVHSLRDVSYQTLDGDVSSNSYIGVSLIVHSKSKESFNTEELGWVMFARSGWASEANLAANLAFL